MMHFETNPAWVSHSEVPQPRLPRSTRAVKAHVLGQRMHSSHLHPRSALGCSSQQNSWLLQQRHSPAPLPHTASQLIENTHTRTRTHRSPYSTYDRTLAMNFLVGRSLTNKSLTYSDQELYRSRNIYYLLHTQHPA